MPLTDVNIVVHIEYLYLSHSDAESIRVCGIEQGRGTGTTPTHRTRSSCHPVQYLCRCTLQLHLILIRAACQLVFLSPKARLLTLQRHRGSLDTLYELLFAVYRAQWATRFVDCLNIFPSSSTQCLVRNRVFGCPVSRKARVLMSSLFRVASAMPVARLHPETASSPCPPLYPH